MASAYRVLASASNALASDSRVLYSLITPLAVRLMNVVGRHWGPVALAPVRGTATMMLSLCVVVAQHISGQGCDAAR